MRFVVISARSTFSSSQFLHAASAARSFLRVGRTFFFALARSGFGSGEHASVVLAPALMRWLVSRGES